MREPTTALGRKIRSARQRRGMTQRELARRARIDYRTVSLYEIGSMLPGAKTAARLSYALRIDIGVTEIFPVPPEGVVTD